MFTNFLTKQLGGGAKSSSNGSGFLILLLLSAIQILIGSYLVQVSYNYIGPILMRNAGHDIKNFRPLNYGEAVIFWILVHSLIY
jgi:hypothetical protein